MIAVGCLAGVHAHPGSDYLIIYNAAKLESPVIAVSYWRGTNKQPNFFRPYLVFIGRKWTYIRRVDQGVLRVVPNPISHLGCMGL